MRGLDIAFRGHPPPVLTTDTRARATAAPFFAPRVEDGKGPAAIPVAKLNCSGHGCPERETCRRYLVMVPCSKRLDADGREHPNYEWASFDVERAHFGSCSAFAVVAQARPMSQGRH